MLFLQQAKSSCFALGRDCECAALFTVVFLANSPSAFGQGATGAINGTVTDTSGAVIPGAKVTLQNTATGAERVAITNATGIYVFVEVIPGNYTMQVSAQGFATVKEEAFTLSVNQTSTHNFTFNHWPHRAGSDGGGGGGPRRIHHG